MKIFFFKNLYEKIILLETMSDFTLSSEIHWFLNPKILFSLASGDVILRWQKKTLYAVHSSQKLEDWTTLMTLGEACGLPKVISYMIDSFVGDRQMSAIIRVPREEFSVMRWEPEISTICRMKSAISFRVFWDPSQKASAKLLFKKAIYALEASSFGEDLPDHNAIFTQLTKEIPSAEESKKNKQFYITHHECCKHCAKDFSSENCTFCSSEKFYSYDELYHKKRNKWEKKEARKEEERDFWNSIRK